MRFAGFIVYDEKFEEKMQIIWSGRFWGKAEAGQTGKLVRSFVELSRCGDQVSGVE